ncbi:DUF2867 domain-containing protein [Dinoroseobacter sp. S76]|uniref:DUF2867 domain-containing protein n=1 Tax=Dinoroseobacter sp. S76 TaxID=3415124 RepID=UPI003C7BBE5A
MIILAESNARILAPVPELDYFDVQTAPLCREVTPLAAWNAMVEDPQPFLAWAFWVRDRVSVLFGVKAIGGFSGEAVQEVSPGDRLDFFLVEHVDDESLVLTERDRHLDVMTCISMDGPQISVTSSVRVHNRFGHAYMLPVGIAHRWIVRGMLKRLQGKLAG